jgi:hypothetical protein
MFKSSSTDILGRVMKHWNRLSLLAVACIVGWVRHEALFTALAASDVRNAVGVAAQISATMLGFLLAALAILASISGHRLVRNMQRSGHYRVLLRVVYTDSIAFGAAMLVSLAGLITVSNLASFATAALAVFSYASAMLVDVAYRFWLVLANLTPDSQGP